MKTCAEKQSVMNIVVVCEQKRKSRPKTDPKCCEFAAISGVLLTAT